MNGRHYGSVFLHWFPANGWNWTMWDMHVAVPPDATTDGARPAIFEKGRPPFLRSYHEYWNARGMVDPRLEP